jgi:sugar lactone lactonase YvrE
VGVCACTFFVLAHASHAWAQSADPAVAKGVTWLQSQVQSNGSLSNEANTIATPLQVRAEALNALALGGAAPASLITSVSADTTVNTDYLSRRTLALQAAQHSATATLTALSQLQNADGGWALATGFSSHALDTSLALMALCRSSGYSTQTASGISALAAFELPDGGFGLTDADDLYVSLIALRALNACAANPSVAATATSLTTWMLAQRTASLDFGNVQFNALGLIGLLDRTNDASVLTPLVTVLHANQAADGSWSEDPYLTALAIQALGYNSKKPPPSATGGISGLVADAAGNPLSGATVQLVEAPQFVTTSAADGSFSMSGVAPGVYTVRAQLLGYSVAQKSANVTAGTTVDVGTLTLAAASLTATLTGHIQNVNQSPITNAVITVGPVFATTNSAGNYILTGLPPGPATITVAAPGYQTVTASTSLAGGQTYVLSPTLYSTAPPANSVTGKIVDAKTSAAISAAHVAIGTQTATTLADGTFTLTGVNAGSFSMSVTASNYLGATVTGLLADGVNNVGTISLTPAPTTSSLGGTVTDSASGNPITGAIVAIQGTALKATTDATGHYAITSISQTTFVVSVSAPGYLTQQASVQLSSPGAATLNAALVASTSSGITFTSITTSAPRYAPNDTLQVNVTAANGGSSAVDLVVQGDVLDSQGNVVATVLANPVGPTSAIVNQPINLAASSSTNITLTDLLQRSPAGTYTMQVRGFSTAGQVLAEGSVVFSVTAEAILSGMVDADPPVLQVGTNTPVHITAQIGDLGNLPIAAGNANLKVTLDSIDASYNSQDQAALKLLSISPLAFSPTALVADGSGNWFATTYWGSNIIQMSPAGQVGVARNLSALGIYNPTDLAIDSQGNSWVASYSVHMVTPQGVSDTITLSSGMGVYGLAVDAAGTQYYAGGSTLEKRDAQGNETILWQGGMNLPVGLAQNPDGSFVVSNYGDGTLVHMSAAGAITPFTQGLKNPQGVVRATDGSYIVANSGANTLVKVAADGTLSTFSTGFNGPYGLVFDSGGDLLVSDTGDDTIYRVHPDGSKVVYARSLMHAPDALAYGVDSSLYIAQNNGTVKHVDPQGNVTALASGLGLLEGIAVDGNGVAYVASYDTGSVKSVSQSSGATDFAIGLSSPMGVAFDANHQQVSVAEYGANRLRWYDTGGNELGRNSAAACHWC